MKNRELVIYAVSQDKSDNHNSRINFVLFMVSSRVNPNVQTDRTPAPQRLPNVKNSEVLTNIFAYSLVDLLLLLAHPFISEVLIEPIVALSTPKVDNPV
jgi:hypothetical protein